MDDLNNAFLQQFDLLADTFQLVLDSQSTPLDQEEAGRRKCLDALDSASNVLIQIRQLFQDVVRTELPEFPDFEGEMQADPGKELDEDEIRWRSWDTWLLDLDRSIAACKESWRLDFVRRAIVEGQIELAREACNLAD